MNITSSERWRSDNFGRGGVLPEIGTPLTTTLLRSIKLSEIVTEHRAAMSFLLGELAGEQEMSTRYSQSPAAMRPATERRLRRVADTYRAAWADGQPPTKTVARREGISDAAAAKLVARARAFGLLPPTSPGVASGSGLGRDGA